MTDPITLAEAKNHLRVMHDDEDAYIETLITAARQYAENYQNRVYVEKKSEDGSVIAAEEMPVMEKAACLLLIGHWFENRTAVNIGNIATEIPLSTISILNLRRDIPI